MVPQPGAERLGEGRAPVLRAAAPLGGRVPCGTQRRVEVVRSGEGTAAQDRLGVGVEAHTPGVERVAVAGGADGIVDQRARADRVDPVAGVRDGGAADERAEAEHAVAVVRRRAVGFLTGRHGRPLFQPLAVAVSVARAPSRGSTWRARSVRVMPP